MNENADAPAENPYYPKTLERAEARKVRHRRGYALPKLAPDAPLVGLALSGGGIRSATFNLGVLQALARRGLLRRFDFLSTVSGGGYIGSFLGAWIHREGVDGVEQMLPDNESPPVRFLRENGRYLAPNGAGDAWVALATHLRGWVALLLTLGTFVFGGLMAVAALHETAWLRWSGHGFPAWACRPAFLDWLWWSPWWWVAGAAFAVLAVPVGAAFWLLGAKPLRLPPVFWLLVAGCVVVALLPGANVRTMVSGALGLIALGSALVCLSERREADTPALARQWLGGAVLLFAFAYYALGGFALHWPWDWRFFSIGQPLATALAALHIPAHHDSVVRTLLRAGLFVGAVVWAAAYFVGARRNDLDYVRRDLTELLALALAVSAGFALLAVVDTLGGSWFCARGSGVLTGHAIVVALWAAVQWAGPRLLAKLEDDKQPSLPLALGAAAVASVVALALLALLSFWAHALADRLGAGFTQSHLLPAEFVATPGSGAAGACWLTAAGILFACAVAGRSRAFLNLSADLPLYTARLTRAYLGATNFNRHDPAARRKNPEVTSVTRPVAGDDVPHAEYHPEACGGPLHVVNVTVNETVLGKSGLEQRDRHGLSLALGPVGVSVGRETHAVFPAALEDTVGPTHVSRIWDFVPQRARPFVVRVLERAATHATVEPLPGPAFHALAAVAPPPAVPHHIEMLTLGQWMGVSGAAFTTGLGQNTTMGFSFLAGIFNVRLGYWWDSDVRPWQRRPFTLRLMASAGVAAASVFPAQTHLLDELLARFHGPVARRYWYLSDGGHFENTAAYELIRRRVAFIVVCDCGADEAYAFDDLGGLVRKARIDFGAEITVLDRAELDALLPRDLAPLFGPLAEFRRNRSGCSARHAALARIAYANGATGWLLVLKPTVRGDEPADVRNYHLANKTFPQQSTLDQFFDEAQWESYRRLGELIAERVFADASSLVPPPPAAPGWRPSTMAGPAPA